MWIPIIQIPIIWKFLFPNWKFSLYYSLLFKHLDYTNCTLSLCPKFCIIGLKQWPIHLSEIIPPYGTFLRSYNKGTIKTKGVQSHGLIQITSYAGYIYRIWYIFYISHTEAHLLHIHTLFCFIPVKNTVHSTCIQGNIHIGMITDSVYIILFGIYSL